MLAQGGMTAPGVTKAGNNDPKAHTITDYSILEPTRKNIHRYRFYRSLEKPLPTGIRATSDNLIVMTQQQKLQ